MTVCYAPCPIVFDLDGTLIDSAPDIRACANTVLETQFVAPLSLDRIRSFIGGGVDVLWQKIIAATGLSPARHDELVAAFMTHYHSATSLTVMLPGVAGALDVLAARGHPLAICTNKPLGPTKAITEHLGIASYFQVVIGGDSMPEKKPDPAPLLAAFVGLGADPQNPRGIYVGDSEYDATCASRIPVPFLIYTEGYRLTAVDQLPHLAAFGNWADLPDLVAAAVE